jgi:hypothetical protein
MTSFDFIVDKGLEYKLGARGCVLYARRDRRDVLRIQLFSET